MPPRRASRAGLVALCAVWLAACSDGYPTEDVAPVDPARMTQAQLLVALNRLGEEPHLGKRWRYSLQPNCALAVSVRNGDRARSQVVLEDAELSTRSIDGVSEIRLVPKDGGEPEAVTVLETPRWSDTVRARFLLTYLEVRCGNPEVPDA